MARKPIKIITPEQFDAIYDELLDGSLRLLTETDIETGLRWGELTELRVKDFARKTRIITASRAVVQVDPKFHPDGARFPVKQYPKDGEYRCIKISDQLAGRIDGYIVACGLGPDDLIFPMPPQGSAAARLRTVPERATLGFTKPNAAGRRYWHGTMSGYNAGRCRCQHGKDAAAIYRAQRRAAGKDSPRRPRTVDTDGHISRDWFRMKVWRPALERAGITFNVRAQDLRHAHASWLLAGGADLQMVKERLGHGSISTTEKYLHTLPDADEAALDAFSKIRNRSTKPGLLAAFMTTADAAVDGREALTVAPSLPHPGGGRPEHPSSADAGAGRAIDVVAQLASVLRERLAEAAGQADLPGDQAACLDAASAAGRICQLMTR